MWLRRHENGTVPVPGLKGRVAEVRVPCRNHSLKGKKYFFLSETAPVWP